VTYRLESVTKFFRQGRTNVCALDGLTLQVATGEHLALLGRSGAGKSTLFRLLNATIRPTSGVVAFEGRDVGAMPGAEIRAMRRRIGTVYQQHNLVPALSVLDNTLAGALGRWSIGHTARAMIRPYKVDLDKALDALESVGLADKRHAQVLELSGGQQQRVAIARVLMQDSQVILADEPVASLDPGLADDIIRLLTRIAEDSRRTLLVSVHRVDLARAYFPRVVGLRSGAVEFDAPPSEVHDMQLTKLYATSRASSSREQHESDVRPNVNCDCVR
jgi:phosphonate transport system ATP-binding protein